jgi:hypothetical protein
LKVIQPISEKKQKSIKAAAQHARRAAVALPMTRTAGMPQKFGHHPGRKDIIDSNVIPVLMLLFGSKVQRSGFKANGYIDGTFGIFNSIFIRCWRIVIFYEFSLISNQALI